VQAGRAERGRGKKKEAVEAFGALGINAENELARDLTHV